MSLHIEEEKTGNRKSLYWQLQIMREPIRQPRNRLAESQDNLIDSLRAQEENPTMSPNTLTSYLLDSHLPDSKIAPLENTVQELRNELAKSQRAANEQRDTLNEMIRSLRADLRAQETSSSAFFFSFVCSRFLDSLSVTPIPQTKK